MYTESHCLIFFYIFIAKLKDRKHCPIKNELPNWQYTADNDPLSFTFRHLLILWYVFCFVFSPNVVLFCVCFRLLFCWCIVAFPYLFTPTPTLLLPLWGTPTLSVGRW